MTQAESTKGEGRAQPKKLVDLVQREIDDRQPAWKKSTRRSSICPSMSLSGSTSSRKWWREHAKSRRPRSDPQGQRGSGQARERDLGGPSCAEARAQEGGACPRTMSPVRCAFTGHEADPGTVKSRDSTSKCQIPAEGENCVEPATSPLSGAGPEGLWCTRCAGRAGTIAAYPRKPLLQFAPPRRPVWCKFVTTTIKGTTLALRNDFADCLNLDPLGCLSDLATKSKLGLWPPAGWSVRRASWSRSPALAWN